MDMKSTKIAGDAGAETRVVILESGEEAFAALTKFANDAGIAAASLTAIGAFESATVGWFDFDKKTYKKIEVAQQCEVLSAMGDIAVGDDGKASLHVHVVLGLSDGTTRGGHLKGKVRPTLEVVLTDTPAKLRRKKRGRYRNRPYRPGSQGTLNFQRIPRAFSNCRLLIFERPSICFCFAFA
jgi:predicted DNA-binding protein with PD1-like motif